MLRNNILSPEADCTTDYCHIFQRYISLDLLISPITCYRGMYSRFSRERALQECPGSPHQAAYPPIERVYGSEWANVADKSKALYPDIGLLTMELEDCLFHNTNIMVVSSQNYLRFCLCLTTTPGSSLVSFNCAAVICWDCYVINITDSLIL